MAKGDAFGGMAPTGGATGLASIMARRSAPRPNDATGYAGPTPIQQGPAPRPMLPPMGVNPSMGNVMAPVPEQDPMINVGRLGSSGGNTGIRNPLRDRRLEYIG